MTISKERVIELANGIWDVDKWADPAEARLQRFAQAIRNEALEEMAIEFENCFSESGETISEAIRNLKEQQ